MVEICSALFTGTDAGKYGTQKDAVAKKLSALGEAAAMGDFKVFTIFLIVSFLQLVY
jgi:hypothetical protein